MLRPQAVAVGEDDDTGAVRRLADWVRRAAEAETPRAVAEPEVDAELLAGPPR